MAETFPNVRRAMHEAGYHEEATDEAIQAFWKTHNRSIKAPEMVQWCLDYMRQPEQPKQREYNAPPPETPIDAEGECYRLPTLPVPAEPEPLAQPDYPGMHRAEIACLTERMRIVRTMKRADDLFARIAACPERMHDSRLRFAIPDAPIPPPINEKAPLPNGAVYR